MSSLDASKVGGAEVARTFTPDEWRLLRATVKSELAASRWTLDDGEEIETADRDIWLTMQGLLNEIDTAWWRLESIGETACELLESLQPWAFQSAAVRSHCTRLTVKLAAIPERPGSATTGSAGLPNQGSPEIGDGIRRHSGGETDANS